MLDSIPPYTNFGQYIEFARTSKSFWVKQISVLHSVRFRAYLLLILLIYIKIVLTLFSQKNKKYIKYFFSLIITGQRIYITKTQAHQLYPTTG